MKKKSNKKKNIFIIVAVLFAGILMGTAAFGLLYFNPDNSNLTQTDPETGETVEITPVNLDKRVSFLLIGADKRPGDDSFNADSIIVASVDPDTKIISMLSVPRDTRVSLGSSQFIKLNSVPMLRGIPELMKEVTNLTGIPLDGYVMTNFEGFKSIIDTLGGVTIYVEKEMGPYETGDKEDGIIHLLPGEQRMKGSLALQYARYRNDAMADISRTARQQNVLKAVAKEMLQVSTITKIPKLIPQLTNAVETNLSMVDILKLSKVAASFNSSNIISQTLPGAFLDFDGISYWEVNREQAKKISDNLLMGITTDMVIDYKVVDLLDPQIRSHITVPGSPKDPNGVKSPGHDSKFNNDSKNPESDTQDTNTDTDSIDPDNLANPDNKENADNTDNGDNIGNGDNTGSTENTDNNNSDTENTKNNSGVVTPTENNIAKSQDEPDVVIVIQ